MKPNAVDLHVHSTCSDGTFSPARLVGLALEKGLCAFALTDHDTVAGIKEARAEAAGRVEVVSGIEFSTEYLGQDVHIVGLDFDEKDPKFLESLRQFQDSRTARNEAMVEKMRQDGIAISMDALREEFGEAVLTRAHVAHFLARHGIAQSWRDAYANWIGEGCRYYVPREKVTPQMAVRVIASARGIPVFAHPMLCRLPKGELRALLSNLRQEGLIGIEVLYSTYSLEEEREARALQTQLGLLPSGGSDFHGANKPSISLGNGRGSLYVPYEILRNLRARRDAQWART